MKKYSFIYIAFIAFALCAFAVFISIQWQPKEGEYAVSFSSDKASGVINGLKGKINFDKDDIEHSGFDVTVDVNTLNTGNWLKNKHAKADDFLDVEHYHTIHFVSSKIIKAGNGYSVSGSLTIKNVTRQMNIPFVFSQTGNEGKFTGYFKINRSDYNLVKDGLGSDSVKIGLSIPVAKI
ncbi:MAG: YceI family protein [Arachidicoccus sp.]|nr:YceI family protein [Arachidicoccus sp.]